MKQQYGLNLDMTALDWLEQCGASGIPELKPGDHAVLLDAGIITEDGQLNERHLALALKLRCVEVTYGNETTVEPFDMADPRIAALPTRAHDPSFGMSPNHPFAKRLQ